MNFRPFGFQVPSGTILLWHGSMGSIPAGWHKCDGTNGTPDLRGRFVICPDSVTYNQGDTGGTTSHTHVGGVLSNWDDLALGNDVDAGDDYSYKTDGHTHSISLESISHLPPYHALFYIMKL